MNVSAQLSIKDQQAYYDKHWREASERPNRLELWRLTEILKSMVDTEINFAVQEIKIHGHYHFSEYFSAVYKEEFDTFLNDPEIKGALAAAAAGS